MAPAKKNLLAILRTLHPEKNNDELYAAVLHGDVTVNGHREKNPKTEVSPGAEIRLGNSKRYVSRGGEKLESVLAMASKAGFVFENEVVLDAGASTGGFSDCLLQHGAKAVHCVDVGYNQLDFRLRNDSRVYVHERCNVLSLSMDDLNPRPGVAVADLSFRSMEGVARAVLMLLDNPRPLLLGLIKPQFELEYSNVAVENFSGVIRDQAVNDEILKNTFARLDAESVEILGYWPSAVAGGSGNREVFALMTIR